jgi:hypothetical protein
MKKTIEIDEKCKSCNGTGLYVGMAERDGAAIVCSTCKGTGCHKFKHEYEDFICKDERGGVRRVYQTNPGICIGEANGYLLEDFGGMSVKEWLVGFPFERGMENRRFTCPCWWYQSADYKLKPNWKECGESLGRSFSHCPKFVAKAGCWTRFDREMEDGRSRP